MSFWEAKAYDSRSLKHVCVYVEANYDKERIIELLKEVHPEWEQIVVLKAIRPSDIKAPSWAV